MLGPQRSHQRVLHQVVGKLGVVGERARIAPQSRNRRLDALSEARHICLLTRRLR